MKKILFINPHFPLFSTPACGGANRSQMFLRALTHVGHVDVVSLWENEHSSLPNCDVIYSGCPDLGSANQYGRYEKYFRLLAPWNVNNIFPINKCAERFCDELIAKGDYDYIAIRYLFTAAEFGLLKYADRLVVDVDDNPANTLRVRMHKVQSRFAKLYFAIASVSASIMTCMVLPNVFASFYSNPAQFPSRRSVYLPNIPVQNTPLISISDSTPMRGIIVGSWAYYPNKHGLIHFIKEIWPRVIQKIPDARVDIIGRMNDQPLKDLCECVRGIVVRGFVDDLQREYADARCAIVPVYYGSGTCVKVIETMCMNRPFVSTPCGVRGIEHIIVSGQDYLLANNDEEFAQCTVSLLQNPEYGAKLAQNALDHAQKYFSQDSFNQIVKNNICKQ